MRGPKPVPSNVKRFKGNPGKRPLNEKEPQSELVSSVPKPPAWLKTADAKRIWQEQVEFLIKNRILGKNEQDLLASYCFLQAEFIREAKTGRTPNASLVSQMRALAATFGIGPAERSRIKTGNGKEEEEDIREFIG
jgi:phage terminase small subunit